MQGYLHRSQMRNVTFPQSLRHFSLPAPLSLLVTVNVVRHMDDLTLVPQIPKTKKPRTPEPLPPTEQETVWGAR